MTDLESVKKGETGGMLERMWLMTPRVCYQSHRLGKAACGSPGALTIQPFAWLASSIPG